MHALDDALRVIASLNAAEVDYVVVGGVALNIHGLVRATEDLDLFVRPEPENIRRLRQALKAVWDEDGMPVQKFRSIDEMPRVERVSEAELTDRIRALWGRSFQLCPRTLTRGVRRFRSIEEAHAERLRETVERMRHRASQP